MSSVDAYPWQDEETLLDLYDDGLNPKEIAAELGCHYGTIYTWLAKFGVDFQDPKEKPPNIYTGNHGYVRVRSEYKGEEYNFMLHRLLAVAEYGYEAVVGMQVHHKNRIPWANWPSNIELLTASEHGRLSSLDRWNGRGRENPSEGGQKTLASFGD